MRQMKQRFMLAAAMVLCASALYAQDAPPATPVVNVNETIAYAINTVLVFTLLQVVKNAGPKLPAVAKQILALAAGPVLMMVLGPAVSGALGYPVDFSALAAALGGLASGATAIAAFDLRNGK